jgi:hypothetical protein
MELLCRRWVDKVREVAKRKDGRIILSMKNGGGGESGPQPARAAATIARSKIEEGFHFFLGGEFFSPIVLARSKVFEGQTHSAKEEVQFGGKKNSLTQKTPQFFCAETMRTLPVLFALPSVV